jgi:hypothetical protein
MLKNGRFVRLTLFDIFFKTGAFILVNRYPTDAPFRLKKPQLFRMIL